MIRADLNRRIQLAIDALVREGRLPAGLPAAEVADPRDPTHGDFATNFALVASKPAGKNPRELAEMVRDAVTDAAVFESIEVAGPGFINFRLTPGYIAGWLPELLSAGENLAREAAKSNPNPQRINVEFVSVNPNGPITIGSGRGAAFGSTLCSVLEAAGNTVHREYYINDGVNSEQMRQFAHSIFIALCELFGIAPGRDRAYKGDYVNAVAETFLKNQVPVNLAYVIKNRGWTEKQYRSYREGIRQVLLVDREYVYDWMGGINFSTLHFAAHEISESSLKSRRKFNSAFDELLLVEEYVGLRFGEAFGSNYDWWLDGCPDPYVEGWIVDSLLDDALRYFTVRRTEDLFAHHASDSNDTGLVDEMGFAEDKPKKIEGWLSSRINQDTLKYAMVTFLDSWFADFVATGRISWGIPPTTLQRWIDDWHKMRVLEPKLLLPKLLDPDEGIIELFRLLAQDAMIAAQKSDLSVFATEFDTWFSEQSLHDRGIVAQDIEALATKGAADERPIRNKLKLGKGGVLEDVEIEAQAGATDEDELTPPPNPLPASGEGESRTLWLRSTKFGDDQDRVLRRQDGRLTYIASDVAYHKDKFNRPAHADKLITILGPDHHGYIGRLHAVVAALELKPVDNPNAEPVSELEAKLYASPAERDACEAALASAKEKLEVVIFQLVRFMKDGKPAPMRKRDGNIYALIDLVDEIGRTVKPIASKAEQQEVGKDVARFFYLMRSHDTTFDFDLDLAERQSDENPVFYVQYAHARICSVLQRAKKEIGYSPRKSRKAKIQLLAHPKELALIKIIADLPHEVSRTAEDYGVHRMATYAIDLARAYHHFYDACRVIQPEQTELSRARLALCEATRNALRSVFKILGISAPERMDRTEASA